MIRPIRTTAAMAALCGAALLAATPSITNAPKAPDPAEL
jgi:hypothetical protein